MRTAFYAPLKPMDHLVASGDRLMARQFFAALQRIGCNPFVACRLRTFDKTGNEVRQERLRDISTRMLEPLAARLNKPNVKPDLWVTYHLYHKAPDWIGPRISSSLGIPYLAAEVSIARKQRNGRWRIGYEGAELAIRAARKLLAMTELDARILARDTESLQKVELFPPFIDSERYANTGSAPPELRRELAGRYALDLNKPWLIAVAMMRNDVKLSSYLELAASLRSLSSKDWQLLVVGDGPAREIVEDAFAPLKSFVRFAGELPPAKVAEIYHAGDLFCWPGFDEAYGIVFLEAQAAGLPVLAYLEGGIGDIVHRDISGMLIADRNRAKFVDALAALLRDLDRRLSMGAEAKKYVAETHSQFQADQRLRRIVGELMNPPKP